MSSTSGIEFSGRPESSSERDELTSPSSFSSSLPIHLPEPFIPPSLAGTRPPAIDTAFPPVPDDEAVKEVDPQDIDTPDSWVRRDPRMVRLTGRHPFNAEPKLNVLFSKGFFTPSNLFYTRNHGAVPQVDMETAREWKITIRGLCEYPVTFTVEQLVSRFEVISTPVTLVCAGNRRKEQNIVKKSLGFSWGAAAVSTALFTGVRLADILDHVKPTRGAKHVIFEGSDTSLPDGPYGTSQLLSWAQDRRKCMMLAWAMNGLPLEPDHGFPLRLVVPGQIGGRSVKWLRSIELSSTESKHYLHLHDNKVLPMPIDPDHEIAEEWWCDPRYIIRELNVNSVIACPDHGEVVEVQPEGAYTLRGYIYAGGGRRITHVEVSINNGDTWELAEIDYPEDAFRSRVFTDSVYGALDLTDSEQCYCWSFWSLKMRLMILRDSSSICVRAMDESLALQPRDMYWNVTGMMNNWWFRVFIHVLEDGRLQFEHPTLPATQPGGWMQRLKDHGKDPSKPDFSVSLIFALDHKERALGLPIGQTIALRPGTNWTSWITFAVSGIMQGSLLTMCIIFHFRQRRLGLDEFGNSLAGDTIQSDFPGSEEMVVERGDGDAAMPGLVTTRAVRVALARALNSATGADIRASTEEMPNEETLLLRKDKEGEDRWFSWFRRV